MNNLEQHIDTFLADYRERQLFIGCSGGVDSMVLLSVLNQLKFNVTALHVNYHLRGEESDLDQQMIEKYCLDNGIDVHVRSIFLEEELKNGGNLQELARNHRYAFFNSFMTDNSYTVLAHHQDDQIETFMLNLARNAGLMGLSSMPFKNERTLRPMLNITKDNLYAYAKSNNIPWREDVSNASNKYNRNKVRNIILPFLREQIPTIDTSILTLIEVFQSEQLSLTEEIQPLVENILDTGQLNIREYEDLNPLAKVELFRQLGYPATIIREVDKLLSTQKGKFIELTPNEHSPFYQLVKETTFFSFLKCDHSTMELSTEIVDHLPTHFQKDELYLDVDKIEGELRLRRWNIGDRIAPIGVNGSQLISKIIADAKLSAQDKNEVYILEDNATIHWCVNYKIGRLAIAQANTSKIVKCTVTLQAPH